MSKRKVDLIVLGPTLPYRGGISDSNTAFINSLLKLGLNIKVISFKRLYPNFLFPGKSQFINEKLKFKKFERKLDTINPFGWYRVRKLILKINPKFIIFRYWTPFLAPLYYFISKKTPQKIKKIAIVDNWIPHEKSLFDKILNYYFAKNMNLFITFSKNVSDRIKKSGFKNIYSLYHPINDDLPDKISKKKARKKLNLLEDEKYVLFFGLIREYKGLDILINSFSKNPVYKKKINLIILGEFYENINYYKRLINNLKLNSKVIMIPKFVDDFTIRDYFCASDLIAQTYKKASQSGVTPIAYKYNLPILVSNVKGLKEIILDDKSGCITKNNPDSISKNIVYCLKKKNQKLFIDQISSKYLKYTWKNFSLNLLNLLKNKF